MIMIGNIPYYFFNSIIIIVSTPLVKFSGIKKEEVILIKISYWNDTKLFIPLNPTTKITTFYLKH